MTNHLGEILNSAVKSLLSDYEQTTTLKHRGAMGSIREEFLLEILRKYMPRNVSVYGSCEIVDSLGGISPQIDIAITDPAIPPLFEASSHKLIPVECLYATVEVKSDLDTEELIKSCESFAATARLKKLAYFDQPGYKVSHGGSGMTWQSWPTLGVIFGYQGANIKTLFETFARWCDEHDASERPHSVWVLGKGRIYWALPDAPGDAVVPMGGTVLESNILSEDGHALTAMILTLWNELARARMPAFKLGRYVEHEQLGLHWHLRSNHVFGAKAGDGHCNHEAAKAEV